MTFDEWFDEPELYSSRNERFFNDLDHFKPDSKGAYNRQVEWLKAAFEAGKLSGDS